jgi:prolyl-tRNA synthetase
MRMSGAFGLTLREAPADAEVESQRLLVRAGYIRHLGTGIYSYLPLARRALNRIEKILREEMEAIGGQEITMPVVHPAELWKQTGRWDTIGAEMGRFKDRAGRDMVLAMTHEEVVAELARSHIRSWRDLPRLVYQIQTKWRDDPRPRAGLIRVREFTMKDSYSLDADQAGLDRQYQAHKLAYERIFRRCGLPVTAVSSDTGMMGGQLAHEFMYLTPAGEDTLLICDTCGYTANRQVARFRKAPADKQDPRPAREVATPQVSTIADLARFLGASPAQTAKAVFFSMRTARDSAETLVFAVVRGDMEVNETKLSNAVKATELRPAREDEIRGIGSVPGYASPVGLRGVLVVADDAVAASPNLVAGANREGFHLLDTNCGRDWTPSLVADIAAAPESSGCPECGRPMRSSRGVEVGNIFKLGSRYTDALGCSFLDRDGQSKSVLMGSYGIGLGRLLACIAEEHHDERGLALPVSVAPFALHLVLVPGGEARKAADRMYDELRSHGVAVLHDDRDERAGVKFMDADLTGAPLRLTVGDRGLSNGVVELKHRKAKEIASVPLAEVMSRVLEEISALEQAVSA